VVVPLAALALLCICVAGVGLTLGRDRLLGLLGQDTARQQPPPPPVFSTTGRALFGGGGGTVSSADGVSVEVPAGAVVKPDGSPGEVEVSIWKDPDQTVALPAGFEAIGPVYSLEPSGVTFLLPVRLTLPIPPDVDLASIIGLTTLDRDSGEWMGVPGEVNPQARTVSAYVNHFSRWAIIGGMERDYFARLGGWIKVTNTHIRGSTPFLHRTPRRCHRLPQAIQRGVYFLAYNPQNPELLFTKPFGHMLIARDNSTVTWWLPAGTYTLEEWKFSSELNHSPLYVPCFKHWTRPPETIVLQPGQTIVFGDERTLPAPGPLVEDAQTRGMGGRGAVVTPTPTPRGSQPASLQSLVGTWDFTEEGVTGTQRMRLQLEPDGRLSIFRVDETTLQYHERDYLLALSPVGPRKWKGTMDWVNVEAGRESVLETVSVTVELSPDGRTFTIHNVDGPGTAVGRRVGP